MKPKNAISLLLAALIWGGAFVAQRLGMNYVGPFTFNGTRCLIGAVVLLPFIMVQRKRNNTAESPQAPGSRKELFLAGGVCGVCLFVASSLQQIGLMYVSAGKSGFITACYIVIVPVLGIFLHRKTGWRVWVAIVVAVVGLYFLCITETFTIGGGDLFSLGGAAAFAVQILAVAHFAPRVDGIRLSCVQCLVCGVLSLPFLFLFETPSLAGLWGSILPLLYAGVLSCGIAYTLQIIGQRDVNPAVASLLMSLESCFSVLAGWLILGERLSQRELIGCVLMFAAIMLAQLPGRRGQKRERADAEPTEEVLSDGQIGF